MKKYGSIPFGKGMLDILVSTLVLTITSPFIFISIVLIKLTQLFRGRVTDPLFYGETRFSHGTPFTLYKFNIFKYEQILSDKALGKFIHTKHYEKNGGVTWIGWVLKQIYMDELPQFYNVLRGHMSVVGPRPVNKEVFDLLMKAGVTDKAKVRAGITGNFQAQKNVKGKRSETLDREYVEFCLHNPGYKVLLLDLKIIFKTVHVICRAQGI